MNTVTTLTHKAEVYIPQSAGRDYLNKVLSALSSRYGGATAREAQGGYLSYEGELVLEPVWTVTSFTTSQIQLDEFYDIVEYLRSAGEETVGIEVDGVFYLVA